MQFTLAALTALLSLASAAAIDSKLAARAGVCGGISTPVCCELSVLGVATLNCANAGDVSTTDEFTATCAASGTSAQCCVLPLGADALLCTPA